MATNLDLKAHNEKVANAARQPENMSTEALEQAMEDAGFHGFPELDDHQAARLGAIISEWARR